MSALATDIWEFRATVGSANAGGGFDTASGGTDYSNQDSAQLQLTDLATSGTGVTTLTSVTGGFTAAMVGNYIQIRSGTNVEAGFYRVTAHTNTNTVTLDRSPDDGVGGITGGSGDLGGALDIIIDAFIDDTDIVVPGNTIYVKNDGTMTLVENVSTPKDGTNLAPIRIEGYNISRGDNPTGDNRPVIAAGANSFIFDNYWYVKNLIVTTTHNWGLDFGFGIELVNCKITNSSGTANREAVGVEASGRIIGCEVISTNGKGIGLIGSDVRIIGCYLHDSSFGVDIYGMDNNIVYGCVIDTCVEGVSTNANANTVSILNNTFYNCTTAVKASTGCKSWVIINNIFDANTTGVSWGEADKSLYMNHNVWDNTTDVSGGIEKGSDAVNGDPGLTDPANSDFTLTSGSNALGVGFRIGADVGVLGDYKWNIGVDQNNAIANIVIIQRTRRVM